MAKITKVAQKLFGSTGTLSFFGQPGSLPAGTKVNTKDPATIQSLSAFLSGLESIVKTGTYKIAMEDLNSLFLLSFYQIGYLMQAGIAEWDADTVYYIGSLTNVSGTIYKSLTDNNTNNNPASSSVNWTVVSGTPIGATQDFCGPLANIPSGFLNCDGAAVSRTTYANLFAAIGTYWGVGDGSTTFNLPDLTGKVGVGYKSSDSDFNAVGKTGGDKTHTLTLNEIPSHRHAIVSDINGTIPGDYTTRAINATEDVTTYTDSQGGGQAHNNLQPYGVVLKIIKY